MEARRAMRWAWFSLGLLPVSLVAAMLLGDWLGTLQGYDSDAEDLQAGAVLKAGLPAVLLLVSPTVLAAWFGFRAKRHHHPDWRTPVIVAAVVAASLVALNLLQVVVALGSRL